MSGKGESIGAANSSFNDSISYMFNGKDCRVESFLNEHQGDEPVEYWWATFLNQGSIGETGIDMSASPGNYAEFGIRGSSSFVGEQKSPGIYPANNIAPVEIPVPPYEDEVCDGWLCYPNVEEDTGYNQEKNAFIPHMVYVIK
jgi:hypothetical protein